MFSSLFSLLSALFLGLSYLASAAPVQPTEFLAIAPNITAPSAGAVWYTGSQQTVSWLTTNIPPQAQNYTVIVLLGYSTANSTSENLNTKNPLASQIPIMQGSVTFTVPLGIPYGTNYFVVVIGDSGNKSPTITIGPSPSGSSD